VLITRTTLRISIGGGGTDLPSYYREHGATVISAAIDKYVYIAINRTFVADYLLKYSELERADSIDAVQHPIIREALQLTGTDPGVEIASLADIPSGTGLGSSGTFTVGLLRALYALQRVHMSAGDLAEQACHIEIDRLGQPIGKQDQYIAAYGGLTCLEFHPDETVSARPLQISNETLHDLESHLLLFFTGYARAASEILLDQKTRSEAKDVSMLDSLRFTDALGQQIKDALEADRPVRFGELMHEHWMYKRSRSAGMSNPDIDKWYETGLEAGAVGGKLVGAGAGGFLLFYTTDPTRLRAAMTAEGLTEVRFVFDHDGSTVIVRD
jgi:D-glycero-alpha-D-manno-heptose-7-phosphate kinase